MSGLMFRRLFHLQNVLLRRTEYTWAQKASERANGEARRDILGVVTKNMDEDRIVAMDSENQMSIEYTGHGVALS